MHRNSKIREHWGVFLKHKRNELKKYIGKTLIIANNIWVIFYRNYCTASHNMHFWCIVIIIAVNLDQRVVVFRKQ